MLTILTVFLCLMVICGTVESGEISPTEYRSVDPIGPIQELTLRLDGITKYVHELSGLRDRDANQVTKLKQQLENNQARDERVINQLTMKIAQLTRRMEELERNCNNKGQYLQDGSNSRTHVLHTDTSYTVPLGDRNKDSIETAVMEHADNRSQQSVQVQGHLSDIYPQRLTHTNYGIDVTEKQSEERDNSLKDGQTQAIPRFLERQLRVDPSSDNIAFRAKLTHAITTIAIGQILKFNQLATVSGGAHYSTATGVFTCTKSGIYMFSWSIGLGGAMYLYTEIVHNNVAFGSALTGDTSYGSSSSSSVLLHLEVGDEVWVRLAGHSSGITIQGEHSSFMGFRLG